MSSFLVFYIVVGICIGLYWGVNNPTVEGRVSVGVTMGILWPMVLAVLSLMILLQKLEDPLKMVSVAGNQVFEKFYRKEATQDFILYVVVPAIIAVDTIANIPVVIINTLEKVWTFLDNRVTFAFEWLNSKTKY